MNASSKDIRDILEACGESSEYDDLVFSGTGITVFIGREPSTPINSVTIFDTPGFSPYLGLTSVGYEYPSIQIRVRNNAYLTGWDLINDIKTVLHGLNGEIEGTTTYHLIECMLDPFLLDWDTQDRARFVCSFNCQRS